MKRRKTLLAGAPKNLTPVVPHDGMRTTENIMGKEISLTGFSRTQVGGVFGKVDALRNPIDGGQAVNLTTVAKRRAPIEINPGTRSRRNDPLAT
jgi:hypothetical protein